MSSDLLEFDSYYKSPQETHNPPFPSNAAYTPRTNDLLGFESSSTSNWQQSGQLQWPAQASRPNNVLWDDFSSAPISNGQSITSSTLDNPWGNSESQSNALQRPARLSFSSMNNNSGLPKPGIIRQSTLAIFEAPGMSRSSSFDEFDGPIADYIDKKQKQQQSNTKPSSPMPSPLRFDVSAPQNPTPEILFDADDELDASFDDDDFGEFESPITNQIHDIPVLSPEKYGNLSTPQISQDVPISQSPVYKNNYPAPPKSPSFHERNPFSDLVLATKSISEMTFSESDLSTPTYETSSAAWPNHDKKPIKPAAQPEPRPQEVEEEWGDFADLPPETPDVEVVDKTKSNWSWESQTTPPVSAPDSTPPTNIPPPSILLPIFQQLFDLPRSALFQPVANQPFSLKNRILSDPTTVDFLRGYLRIATVASRILAGRKLRWKRDHLLSQAMKIGVASGKGGMKLAGIDKAESAREDREASDTVQIWKEQLGRLRSAIIVANSSIEEKSKHLVIPELNEVMTVKIASVAEGAVTDAKACVLCGIKREERVGKVDIAVEDSFGDFWIQHFGHLDCKRFWENNSAKLRQR